MSEIFLGTQGFDFTSAGHLFGVRQLFQLVHHLNFNKAPEDWSRLEVYPTVEHASGRKIRAITGALGINFPIPDGVTVEYLDRLHKEFPNAEVERIHVDFFYNKREKLWRLPHKSLKGMVFAMLMDFAFGSAYQMRGINLAKELGVGVNIHANDIFGLQKEGRLSGASWFEIYVS